MEFSDFLIQIKILNSIQGAEISNTAPTFENIASNNYSVSRALYIYVKHQHIGVIPGLKKFLENWKLNWSEDGILSDAGMIPMSETEREKYAKAIEELPVLTADILKK